MPRYKTLAKKRGKLIKVLVKIFYRNYHRMKISIKSKGRILRLEQEITDLTAK